MDNTEAVAGMSVTIDNNTAYEITLIYKNGIELPIGAGATNGNVGDPNDIATITCNDDTYSYSSGTYKANHVYIMDLSLDPNQLSAKDKTAPKQAPVLYTTSS